MSPVIYELRSGAKQTDLLTVSNREYFAALQDGRPAPPVSPKADSIAPGGEKTFLDDLALYSVVGIPAGRYQLTARAQVAGNMLRSQALEVIVSAPKARKIASAYCPRTDHLFTAFTHRSGERTVEVYQRETHGPQPLSGTFTRLDDFVGAGPDPELAIAIHTGAPELQGRRWIAWLNERKFGAVQALGGATVKPMAKPITTDLTSPRLLEIGFQQPGNSALFLLVGMSSDGARLQRLISVPNVPIAVFPSVPLDKNLTEKILVRYVPGGKLQVVWTATADGVSRVYRRNYGTNGEPEEASPTVLYERAGIVASIAMEAVGNSEEGWIHVLLANDQKINYVRVPLTRTSERNLEWDVPMPAVPVSAWAVSSSQKGGLPLLAKTEDQILWTQAEGGTWAVLREQAASVGPVRLLAAPFFTFWAEWIDPSFGLRYQKIISPRMP